MSFFQTLLRRRRGYLEIIFFFTLNEMINGIESPEAILFYRITLRCLNIKEPAIIKLSQLIHRLEVQHPKHY